MTIHIISDHKESKIYFQGSISIKLSIFQMLIHYKKYARFNDHYKDKLDYI